MKIWQLMTRLFLLDTSTCRISNTCNQHMLRSVDVLCYYNLMQHHSAFNDLNFLSFWHKNSRIPFLSAAYQVCCSITLYLILDKQAVLSLSLCVCYLNCGYFLQLVMPQLLTLRISVFKGSVCWLIVQNTSFFSQSVAGANFTYFMY